MPKTKKIDFAAIKLAAEGRWDRIIPALTSLPEDVLTKISKDHPCPQCNGESVIWPHRDASSSGSIACRNCTKNKLTSDGIATVATFSGKSLREAAKAVAEFLGIESSQLDTPMRDLIADICSDKRMPVDAFMQFQPKITKRGRDRLEVVRVGIYNEQGEKHSHFDFAVGRKGFFARGHEMTGMFFPCRLPQSGETWLIVQGCEDSAALIGLGFNACGLPTSCMAEKYARLFSGVNVVLAPNLGFAGQSGSQLTGGRLAGIAASIRVARLPGEVVEKGGDGVRDILNRKGGERIVLDAIISASDWKPRQDGHTPRNRRPDVFISLDYGSCVDEVCTHLGELGRESPWIPTGKRERLQLYQRDCALVQVITEEADKTLDSGIKLSAGTQRIRKLPAGQLPLRILEACQLVEVVEKDGEIKHITVPPPNWLINGILTKGDFGHDIRRLSGIIKAPTLRLDGTVLQHAGYDKQTRLLYQPDESFPVIPDLPSQKDATAAAVELLNLVRDFEFLEESDKSAWLSLVLSQIGRASINGGVPLFAITASCRGSGKSLLADVASIISTGKPAARKPYSDSNEEQRKSITAIALEAIPTILLDNVDSILGGASMDAALTATTWSDRVLGSSSTTGELPLRTVWTATGNNLRFGTDIARRVIPIRLAPTVENPEERTGFEHADLLGWVQAHRTRLAVAALTILRAYFVAGRPVQPDGHFASFESWSAVIRGAIVWIGLPDPLKTRETAKADDISGALVRGLIDGLLEVDECGDGITAREIIEKLKESSAGFQTMREIVSEIATSKGGVDAKSLGNSMNKYRGRFANEFQLIGVPSKGGVLRWKALRATGVGQVGQKGQSQASS